MSQLRHFQITGIDFLASRDFAMLCDDAGLGKSAQILGAADKLGLKRILILGPACAGVSWPQQVAQWSPSRRFTDLDISSNFGFSPPGVYFVSFDMISKNTSNALHDALRSCAPWDLLILDEGQYLKSIGANRTRRVYGDDADLSTVTGAIAQNARRVWVLSGTLTPNHAGEAYTHLRALFPRVLAALFRGTIPDQQTFEDEFCKVRDTTYGRVIEGSKNQSTLRAAVKPHLLRRLKKDVLGELPPIDWQIAPITADARAIEHIYQEMVVELGGNPTTLSPDEVVEFLNGFPVHATKRRVLGLAKVSGCVNWLLDRNYAGDKKIIVFAQHTDVLDQLRERLCDHGPVLFDGRTSHADRARNVEAFQEDPNCEFFLGQIVAAGTAITLTAAKTELFVEYAATPGVNYQAASRAHRMGQLDGVQAYFATVANTLDVQIARTAAQRAREIAELFD
jgi:SWI/SNF-related matrix-associated actin-dependent regulator 1 of chromatin subfamily A